MSGSKFDHEIKPNENCNKSGDFFSKIRRNYMKRNGFCEWKTMCCVDIQFLNVKRIENLNNHFADVLVDVGFHFESGK